MFNAKIESFFIQSFHNYLNKEEGWEEVLFVDKRGHLHRPCKIEDGLFVFLEVKTDIITYVKTLANNFIDITFSTKSMDQKELKIQIPEGYEIDESKSTFEKIVFKKKENNLPKSWEEFSKMYEGKPCFYLSDGEVDDYHYPNTSDQYHAFSDSMPTKKLAESVLAFIQLLSLRKAWVGDWKGSYGLGEFNKDPKYVIVNHTDKFKVLDSLFIHGALDFPTLQMANDFLNTFKDLLEKAKDLI